MTNGSVWLAALGMAVSAAYIGNYRTPQEPEPAAVRIVEEAPPVAIAPPAVPELGCVLPVREERVSVPPCSCGPSPAAKKSNEISRARTKSQVGASARR